MEHKAWIREINLMRQICVIDFMDKSPMNGKPIEICAELPIGDCNLPNTIKINERISGTLTTDNGDCTNAVFIRATVGKE